MARQTPNDGVLGLAAAMLASRGSTSNPVSQFIPNPTTDDEETKNAQLADDLADELAQDPTVTKLQVFAGYLGGVVGDRRAKDNPTRTEWQLLYLDPKLVAWLLVDVDSLLRAQNVMNDRSAFGSYDYIWMPADGSVGQGEGPVQENELQARYMRGGFVSAGDFAASVTGGTYAPPTGPLCPLTPGCCGIKTK